MEINFSNAEKVIYGGNEATAVYVGNTKVWDIGNYIPTSQYTEFKVVSANENYETVIINSINGYDTPMVYRNDEEVEPRTFNVIVGDTFKINGEFSLKGTTATIEFLSFQTGLTSAYGMFTNYKGNIIGGLDKLNASNLIRINDMFYNCFNLTSLDLSSWDVSNVTNMTQTFRECSKLTSLDLSSWDVSNVTNMAVMFYGCSSLTELNLSGWDVSKVTTTLSTFAGCRKLTSLNLSGWNISSAIIMSSTFNSCSNLTSLDLSGWNVSNATDMSSMFGGCIRLTSLDLSNWNSSSVTNIASMFYDCKGLTNLDLSGLDTSNVTEYSGMLENVPDSCVIIIDPTKFINKSTGNTFTPHNLSWHGKFTYINIPNYNRYTTFKITEAASDSKITISSYGDTNNDMTIEDINLNGNRIDNDFYDVVNLTYVTHLTSNVKVGDVFEVGGSFVLSHEGGINIELLALRTGLTTKHMFNNYGGTVIGGVDKLDTSGVTNMYGMFSGCTKLTSLDLSNWDVSNVTDMSAMFVRCYSLTELDLSDWDTSNVTDMSDMFGGCHSLTELDLSDLDTSNVTDMSDMFAVCYGLTSLDLSGWDTSNVTNMSYMFSSCHSLTELDLSGWDTSNVTNMTRMFYVDYEYGSSSLTLLDLSGWDTSNVTEYTWMLENVPDSCVIKIDPTKFINKSTGTTFTPSELGWDGTFTYI